MFWVKYEAGTTDHYVNLETCRSITVGAQTGVNDWAVYITDSLGNSLLASDLYATEAEATEVLTRLVAVAGGSLNGGDLA